MPSQERRGAVRVPTTAHVLVAELGCVEADRGRLRDVSLVGAFVELHPVPICGTPVRVLVGHRGDSAAVTLPARVVRVAPEGAGLRFQGLDADASRFLALVVRSFAPANSNPPGNAAAASGASAASDPAAGGAGPQSPDQETGALARMLRKLTGR